MVRDCCSQFYSMKSSTRRFTCSYIPGTSVTGCLFAVCVPFWDIRPYSLKKFRLHAAVNGYAAFPQRPSRPLRDNRWSCFVVSDHNTFKKHVVHKNGMSSAKISRRVLLSLLSMGFGKIRQFFAPNTSLSPRLPHLCCNSVKNASKSFFVATTSASQGQLSLATMFTFHDSKRGNRWTHL